MENWNGLGTSLGTAESCIGMTKEIGQIPGDQGERESNSHLGLLQVDTEKWEVLTRYPNGYSS